MKAVRQAESDDAALPLIRDEFDEVLEKVVSDDERSRLFRHILGNLRTLEISFPRSAWERGQRMPDAKLRRAIAFEAAASWTPAISPVRPIPTAHPGSSPDGCRTARRSGRA